MGFLSGLSSALDVGTPFINAGLDYFSAKQQNDMATGNAREAMRFSGAQSAQQMAFQERMSNTSYQRAVADMRMAGINPMLAYSQGGASSPGGAQAQVSDVVGPAVSSAMSAKRLSADVKSMESVLAVNEAQRRKLFIEGDTSQSIGDLHRAQIRNLGFWSPGQEYLSPLVEKDFPIGLRREHQSLKDALQDYELRGYERAGLRNASDLEDSKFGRGMRYVDRIGQGLQRFIPNFGLLIRPGRGNSAQSVRPPSGEMLRRMRQNRRDMPSLY